MLPKDAKGKKDAKAVRLDANQTSYRVIGCALRVHSAIGPGGLEKAVAACLEHEMVESGLHVEAQVALPMSYRGIRLPLGYRADFVVEECVIVEIKCVPKVLPVHPMQLLNYLRQANLRLGLLLNFSEAHMRDGIHRIVNGLGSAP